MKWLICLCLTFSNNYWIEKIICCCQCCTIVNLMILRNGHLELLIAFICYFKNRCELHSKIWQFIIITSSTVVLCVDVGTTKFGWSSLDVTSLQWSITAYDCVNIWSLIVLAVFRINGFPYAVILWRSIRVSFKHLFSFLLSSE